MFARLVFGLMLRAAVVIAELADRSVGSTGMCFTEFRDAVRTFLVAAVRSSPLRGRFAGHRVGRPARAPDRNWQMASVARKAVNPICGQTDSGILQN